MSNWQDPDPNLASELRTGAGREWVEEAAEDERLTELGRRRSRTLADQARDLAHRGNRVNTEFGGHTFGGTVVAAGEDFVTVEGPGQVADIRIEMARWSLLPGTAQSHQTQEGVDSFRALLQTHSAAQRVVRLALPGGDMVIGKIMVVATDHVEMADVDDRQLVVPLNLVLAVVRSSDSQ